MKRCFILIFLLTSIALLLASCESIPELTWNKPTEESTTLPEEAPQSTTAVTPDESTNVAGNTENQAGTTQSTPSETATTQTPSSSAPESESVSATNVPATDITSVSDTSTTAVAPSTTANANVTSKGYTIRTENGVTYINGIIIANKTYSLPSSYNPGGLLSECTAAFNEMQAAAKAEGLDIYISSGFRSYSTQEKVYKKYCDRDGSTAADRYSARAGHSEHQTGLAIDLNTIKYSFADTAEGKWVAANCWKYGFILRYPENKEEKTGYRYEPWHIRYLGKDLAADVYNSGLCLEEYLGITSVYN